MSTAQESVPCLRCGDFVRETKLPGLALCAACVEPNVASARDGLPPGELRAKLLVLVAACLALSVVAHVVLMYTRVDVRGLALVVLGVGFGLLDGLMGVIALMFIFPNLGYAGFRKTLLDELHLPGDAPFAVAYLLEERAFPLNGTFTHREIGLAAATAEGVVFFGRRGTRLVIWRRDVRQARAERFYQLFPPRTALEVYTGGQTRHVLAFLTGSGNEDARRAREALALLTSQSV